MDYNTFIIYPPEIPTLRVALRVRLHFVPLRMTRTDCALDVVLVGFYASGKMISSPTMNIIKNAHYRRGGYYPPEYNKKDFRQSENLPKLFIKFSRSCHPERSVAESNP